MTAVASPETGAPGSAANVALPPFAGDDAYRAAMDRVVLPVVRAWRPDAIVAQCGVNHHHADPLSHLLTTMPLYPELWERLVALAEDVCSGRLVALGGGGYEPCTAPPRAWALLAARMAGVTVTDPVPESWRRIALDAGCPEPARRVDRGPRPRPGPRARRPGGRRGGRRDRPERRGPVALLPAGRAGRRLGPAQRRLRRRRRGGRHAQRVEHRQEAGGVRRAGRRHADPAPVDPLADGPQHGQQALELQEHGGAREQHRDRDVGGVEHGHRHPHHALLPGPARSTASARR